MTISVEGTPNNDGTADLPHSERGSEIFHYWALKKRFHAKY